MGHTDTQNSAINETKYAGMLVQNNPVSQEDFFSENKYTNRHWSGNLH